jgi:hypothetical protein
MYADGMAIETYPLTIPEDLLGEVRKAAEQAHLSMADAMRQSIRLGLPRLLNELNGHSVKPLTEEESRRCWQTPNAEFDALESHMALLPVPRPES